MKTWHKTILAICCFLGMGLSFVYHFRQDLGVAGEIKAPVHVNIEIDKAYMSHVSVVAAINIGNTVFHLAQETSNAIRSAILYKEIRIENQRIPFINALFLRIPRESAHEVLHSIDGISVFIGNKMFYFSRSDLANLQGREQDGCMLYYLPGLEYKKSVILAKIIGMSWINWHGDFNLAVKLAAAFFFNIKKFIITWCFLICFLVICRSGIGNIYCAMKKKPFLELFVLGLIVLAGFILRFNGYVRYSSWLDEIHTASISANPAHPFLTTFGDAGNPPFYFILLRLWFMVFGWTEQSGRFLSVILGSAAIVSLYFLVKLIANKKAACLAALYMAVNTYLIGFSQEIRSYILMAFLVSIAVYWFILIIQERELSFIKLIWYVILSVLLVNTHYYGVLFVMANFLFFLFYSVRTKTFVWKKIILFFAGNIIIALSLLPFFINTALQHALLNSGFNSWISKPGFELNLMAVLIFLSVLVYIYLRRTFSLKILSAQQCHYFDYVVFVTAVVYLTAFGISQYRPILVTRYLIILLPLLISVIAIIIINIFANSSKLIGSLCIIFAFLWIVNGYEGNPGGRTDIYHEGQAYINSDAEANPQNKSAQLFDFYPEAGNFYGYKHLPVFVPGDTYDAVYFNSLLYLRHGEMYLEAAKYGISADRILRIHANENRCIFKIFQ